MSYHWTRRQALFCALVGALTLGSSSAFSQTDASRSLSEEPPLMRANLPHQESAVHRQVIYVAGGCFWGVEAFFERVPGVIDAVSGYANGKWDHPIYEDLLYRNSGHAETVQVTFDPTKISLADVLRYYFKIIDPTSVNRQGNDRGVQYRTGIYYTTPEEEKVAKAVIAEEQKKWDRPIQVEVVPLKRFDRAEEYHQDYLKKHPFGYCHIDLDEATKGLK